MDRIEAAHCSTRKSAGRGPNGIVLDLARGSHPPNGVARRPTTLRLQRALCCVPRRPTLENAVGRLA